MDNIKLSEYYLDLNKISTLSDIEKETIHSYYRDMLMFNDEKRYEISGSYFNTLQVGGYLKNRIQEERENKIGNLIYG
jgi:hypothetical protein